MTLPPSRSVNLSPWTNRNSLSGTAPEKPSMGSNRPSALASSKLVLDLPDSVAAFHSARPVGLTEAFVHNRAAIYSSLNLLGLIRVLLDQDEP